MHFKKETFLNIDSSAQMELFPHNHPSDFYTRLPFRITDGTKMQLSVKEIFYTTQIGEDEENDGNPRDGKLMFLQVHIPSEEDGYDFTESKRMTAPIIPLACLGNRKSCHRTTCQYVLPYERKQRISVANFRNIGIRIYNEAGELFTFTPGTRVIVTIHLETMDGSLELMI